MELLSLKTFQAVVDEGGVLAASHALNTVQSNVTARIQRLEQELNTQLFYRKGRGLVLTPSGQLLLGYAQQLLQLESQATAAMMQMGEESGELRVGAMEAFAALRLPALLKSVHQRHQGVLLRVSSGFSADLVELVLHHKLDCAFVGGVVEHPELEVIELRQDELVLIYSQQEVLSQLPLILFREGCSYRARALSWQREQGHELNGMMELGSLDAILGCVAVGMGATLMPRWVVEQSRYREELVVEPIAAEWSKVPTLLIQHRDALPLSALDTLKREAVSQIR